MGIAKAQFKSILSNTFKVGNTIKLFSSMPNEATETGGVTMGGELGKYTIQSGDFTISSDGSEAYSTRNMMIYLCETDGGDGTAVGFGVYSGSSLMYFGRFSSPMYVNYNTVPTIKLYNESKGEGVKVTLTSTDVS